MKKNKRARDTDKNTGDGYSTASFGDDATSFGKERRKKSKLRRARMEASATASNPEAVFNDISTRVHSVSSGIVGNLRFSIKLRIALAHVWLLVKVLPLTILVIAIAAGFALAPRFVDMRDAALAAAQDVSSDTQLIETADGVVMHRLAQPVGDKFATVEQGPAELSVRVGKGWGAMYDRVAGALFVTYARGDWQARFSLNNYQQIINVYCITFGIVWLMLILSVLRSGQRTSARLLAPIGDIADTARQLSEKNLSTRINVAGTQNELRNLAVMVNGMLDRIESAYNRQKQFVSDASHELRTPIAVLQGYASLLDRWGKDAPDVRDEAIAAIKNETQSMKELVEDLLFLARHDKRTLKLEPEEFSASELIMETVKETELIARSHKVETGKVQDCTLYADRSSVKQALRIFIDNAVKYTPPGGTVNISCDTANGQCGIAIRDTGMGIRKEDLPRIFDRFYRADQARNAQEGGHGLGLSIARIIITSHGGTINVRSKPGTGSTFTMWLPVHGY